MCGTPWRVVVVTYFSCVASGGFGLLPSQLNGLWGPGSLRTSLRRVVQRVVVVAPGLALLILPIKALGEQRGVQAHKGEETLVSHKLAKVLVEHNPAGPSIALRAAADLT